MRQEREPLVASGCGIRGGRRASVHSAWHVDAGVLPVILVGLPGAGKTTVARELASMLGVQVTDTDAEIRRRARLTIPQIFAAEGEDGFRDRETRTLRHVLESPAAAQGVVALGGGAVLREENRDMLTGRTVVYLRACPQTAAAHVGDGAGRPLIQAASGQEADADAAEVAKAARSVQTVSIQATLNRSGQAGGVGSDSVLERMRVLHAQRAALYQQVASVVVDTDGLTAQEVAQAVAVHLQGLTAPARVQVGASGAGGRDYEVVVGTDLDAELMRMVLHAPGQGRGGVAIVHADVLAESAARYEAAIGDTGRPVVRLEVPGGESAKSAEILARVWDGLGRAGVGRDGVVIGLGGGATTDLAGFAAASWLRGISLIQVPTTLLGMVDAAVGGKTGIDTAWGKNLVGAFHPPVGVVCDMDHLASVPAAELVAGMGEVVKCGFIADPVILDRVMADDAAAGDAQADVQSDAQSTDCPAWLTWDSPVTAELVRRSVAVKAGVVSRDLTESGLREVLNYGHTYAHAIETVTGYRWRHGEAVAVGCVFAAEVAHCLGYLDPSVVDLHRQALKACGLPVSFPPGVGHLEEMLAIMGRDKKVRAGRIRMVLLDGIGSPVRGVEPPVEVLKAAHDAVTGKPSPGATAGVALTSVGQATQVGQA